MKLSNTIFCLSAVGQATAFAPVRAPASTKLSIHNVHRNNALFANGLDHEERNFDLQPIQFDFPQSIQDDARATLKPNWLVPTIAVASIALMPSSAEAATGTNQVISAFVAYGHYLSLLGMVGALMFERLTVKPGMTQETEKTLVFADLVYGASAVALLVSGYYRAVQYGKGWDFYSHEPIFWVKMVFFAILGAASLFPTITSIKRFALGMQDGDAWQPMSNKLADRMKSVINAELVMMGSIPLAATLMSRGVGYSEAIPYQIIGPVLTGVTAAGLGFKYTKEALTWSDEE
jgi:putative membrane protein